LKDSFPSATITFISEDQDLHHTQELLPPYHVTIESSSGSKAQAKSSIITVRHVKQENPGPFPQDKPPVNTIRFTPIQIQAIRSGINPVYIIFNI
jgi:intron-binding protein aquarius